MTGPASTPAFDAAAVEALAHYERSVGILIADDDPTPNQIKALRLATPIGAWDLTRDADGTWVVDGTPVGESVQRQCDMILAFQDAEPRDLEAFQGPDAAARWRR